MQWEMWLDAKKKEGPGDSTGPQPFRTPPQSAHILYCSEASKTSSEPGPFWARISASALLSGS